MIDANRISSYSRGGGGGGSKAVKATFMNSHVLNQVPSGETFASALTSPEKEAKLYETDPIVLEKFMQVML